MSLLVKVSGAWETSIQTAPKVSGAWPTTISGTVKVSGAWKEFLANLTAALTTTVVSGFSSTGPSVTTDYVTCTALNGSGSYSYAWSRTSSDDGISLLSGVGNPQAVFGVETGAINFEKYETWKCTVTDLVTGNTADSAEVTVLVLFEQGGA